MIIIVAALHMEIQWLISGSGSGGGNSGSNLKKVSSWLWEGQYGRHPVQVIKTGVGKENAQKTMNKALLQYTHCAQDCQVINIGWAGALQPYLQVGSIVAAQKICEVSQDGRGRWLSLEADSPSLATLCAIDSVFPGTLLTISRVASIEEKQSLRQQYPEALAVDMESFSIAEICQERQIPVLILRAISDTLSFQLPESFGGSETAVDGQGHGQDQGRDQDRKQSQGQDQDRKQSQGRDQEIQSLQRSRLYHNCRQAAQANKQVLDLYLDYL